MELLYKIMFGLFMGLAAMIVMGLVFTAFFYGLSLNIELFSSHFGRIGIIYGWCATFVIIIGAGFGVISVIK